MYSKSNRYVLFFFNKKITIFSFLAILLLVKFIYYPVTLEVHYFAGMNLNDTTVNAPEVYLKDHYW